MVVTANIPQPGDIIAASQPQLLANNQGFVTTFAVDHVDYNAGGAGKHNKSTYPAQAAPVTGAGEGAVHALDSASNPGRTDLYYKYQTQVGTDFTGLDFPLTIIKAFGRATASGLVAGSSFNVTNANFSFPAWTINLDNAICAASPDTERVMVLLSWEGTTSRTLIYSVTSPTQVVVTTSGLGVTAFSFAILVI